MWFLDDLENTLFIILFIFYWYVFFPYLKKSQVFKISYSGVFLSVKTTYIGTSSLRNAQPHAVPEAAVCDNGSKKNHKREPLVFGQFTINSIMKPESQMREPKTNLHHNFCFFYILFILHFIWIFSRLCVIMSVPLLNFKDGGS